jgi:hypothetical protein
MFNGKSANRSNGYSDEESSLANAALRGAAAGIAGGLAMLLVTRITRALMPGVGDAARTPGELVARRALDGNGRSGAAVMAAGTAAHFTSCAAWGAIYGVAQSRLHPPEWFHGAALGGLSYALLYPSAGLLPRLGIMPPPMQQSLGSAAAPLDASLTFGLTTALAYRALS